MDLDALRCFVAVAQLNSFSGAGRSLRLSPPQVSKRIASLEEALNTSLFSRTTRSVALTPAGTALLPAARRVLEASEDCARAVSGELGPVPHELTLGTRLELGESWLLPLIPELEAQHPGMRVHLFVSSGPDLERLVRSGDLDAAISSRPVSDPSVRAHRLHEERYALFGAPSLLRERPVATLSDLREHTLVDVSAHFDLSHYWRDALPADVDVRWGELRFLGSLALIQRWVEAGRGLAVLPVYSAQPAVDAGALMVVLPTQSAGSDWFRLLHRRGDPRHALFAALVTRLREAPLR